MEWIWVLGEIRVQDLGFRGGGFGVEGGVGQGLCVGISRVRVRVLKMGIDLLL